MKYTEEIRDKIIEKINKDEIVDWINSGIGIRFIKLFEDKLFILRGQEDKTQFWKEYIEILKSLSDDDFEEVMYKIHNKTILLLKLK